MQLWVDGDEDVDLAAFVRRDDPALRRMAVYDAVVNNDYQVIQSAVLLLALIFIMVNLAGDVGYAYRNPRIRFS